MKTLYMIAVLFLIAFLFTSVYAQNADGNNPSLHFTPYYSSYSVELPSQFNYKVMLKIPLSESFTVSPFYHHSNFPINEELTRDDWGAVISFYIK